MRLSARLTFSILVLRQENALNLLPGLMCGPRTVPSPPEEMGEESLLFSHFVWGVIIVDLAGENRKTSKGLDRGD